MECYNNDCEDEKLRLHQLDVEANGTLTTVYIEYCAFQALVTHS